MALSTSSARLRTLNVSAATPISQHESTALSRVERARLESQATDDVSPPDTMIRCVCVCVCEHGRAPGSDDAASFAVHPTIVSSEWLVVDVRFRDPRMLRFIVVVLSDAERVFS